MVGIVELLYRLSCRRDDRLDGIDSSPDTPLDDSPVAVCLFG